MFSKINFTYINSCKGNRFDTVIDEQFPGSFCTGQCFHRWCIACNGEFVSILTQGSLSCHRLDLLFMCIVISTVSMSCIPSRCDLNSSSLPLPCMSVAHSTFMQDTDFRLGSEKTKNIQSDDANCVVSCPGRITPKSILHCIDVEAVFYCSKQLIKKMKLSKKCALFVMDKQSDLNSSVTRKSNILKYTHSVEITGQNGPSQGLSQVQSYVLFYHFSWQICKETEE